MKKDLDIVTLNGENGKKLNFYLDAEVELDGYTYYVLVPVEHIDGFEDDMAMVFRVEGDEFFMEENDDIIAEIERLYYND